MAKTGKLAAFKLGEKNTAMVNLPAQFVTASEANKKGQQYSKLVDYADDEKKTSDLNNDSISELIELKEKFKQEGYANRTSATTEREPIFSSDKLHYNNHDISILRKRLYKAQENGNNIHELAFSLRGDWLVKNNLYDPDTGIIDQDKLKHAQQDIAEILINKGFKLPLGESANDVVWFGVIHQDTDHLNMHLWFAKESQETRPEMLKQKGKYKGQPIGVIPLETIELAKRQFRNQLMSTAEHQKRTDVLKGLGALKKEIVETGSQNMSTDKYARQIQNIYQALPQDQKGRWQVGNSTLSAANTRMSKANHLTNNLLDNLFENDLRNEYQIFQQLGQQFDAFNIEDQGVMHTGQNTLSKNKDNELRKRLANQLYRYLNQVEDNSMYTIDQQLERIKQNMAANEKSKTCLKENYKPSKTSSDTSINFIHEEEQKPHFSKDLRSMGRISRLWRQDVKAEMTAQHRFLQNQKKVEQEKNQVDDDYQQYRQL